jgi:hypothetical protein
MSKKTGPKVAFKYNQDVFEKARDYVEGGYEELEQVIPSGAGLARHLGIARRTLFRWRDDFPEFGELLEGMNSEQEMKCLNMGLNGTFTPVITKLILAKHGYHDKVDSDVTTKGEAVNPTFIFNPVGADFESDV